jgi:cobyrinic acid a,c-diamide synthase
VVPLLCWLPRESTLQIPERHLGLVPGGEHLDAAALIREVADAVGQRFNLAGIVDIARSAGEMPGTAAVAVDAETATDAIAVAAPATATRREARGRPVIAVARDEAFCFYYPENLELLAEAGAAIEFFSPLRGERPAPGAAGVYLGGGYPELHAAQLSSNAGLWQALEELRGRDAPIYAECGGFMVLTQGLVDCEGRRWPMAGLIPGVARMTDKLAALGYRHAAALRANLLADPGDELRAHEFRYSTWTCDEPVAAADAAWQVRGTRAAAPTDSGGFVSGNLLASYLHIHFAQRAGLANRFVQKL